MTGSPIRKDHPLPFICDISYTCRKKTEQQTPGVEGAHHLTVTGAWGVHGGHIPASEEDILIELRDASCDIIIANTHVNLEQMQIMLLIEMYLCPHAS